MNTVAAQSATGIEATLSSTRIIAASTVEFRFARPAGFAFRAGQAIDLALPGVPDGKHAFSIVSAPFADEIAIATRMRASPYKLALGALKPGAKVLVEGPFGSLTLHRAPSRDAVFVAGGIGVTPFMSMLWQAAHDNDARRFTLVYSNRRPEDAAYLSELQALQQEFRRFRLRTVMTDSAGERIDVALVQLCIAGANQPVFYLAGPPAMVAAIRPVIIGAGVDEDDVRAEEFFGY